MDCSDLDRTDLLASYLRGGMPEALRDEVERHFFQSPRCLAEIELLLAVGEALVSPRGSP